MEEKKQQELELLDYKKLYHGNRQEFHCQILENFKNPYETLYLIYKEIAQDLFEEYKKTGISEAVYYDSMGDIELWADEYRALYGKSGIEEYEWIEETLDMKVFKLGRLQFSQIDPSVCKELYDKLGVLDRDITLINVHVQKGDSLDPEECQKSYKMARDFYGPKNPGKTLVIRCDSWLLNPKLKLLLGENSNIVKFQKDFQLAYEEKNNRQMEERVFGKATDDIASYPENTRLQKSLKQRLLAGEEFGTAIGTYVLEEK